MVGFIGCKNNDLVYLNVPKAACTTIKNYMYFLDNGAFHKDPLAIHQDKVSLIRYDAEQGRKTKEILEANFIFTFVRNPMSRVYSLFNQKIYSEGKTTFPRVRKIVVQRYGANFRGKIDADAHRKNFLAFLKFVRDNQKGTVKFRRDGHWMPQYDIVSKALQIRPLDMIGRVEDFQTDFMYVLSKIRRNDVKEIQKFNEGEPPKVFPMKDIINDEIKKLVYAIYEKDFRKFGYDIDSR